MINLEGLLKNPSIRALYLEYLNNLENLRGISKLPNVHKLSLLNLKNMTTLAGLTGLNQLNRLYLSGMSGLADMEGLGHLPSLKQLYIYDEEGSITTLEGVEKVPSIEVIGLGGDGMSSVTQLQALEQLPNLKSIILIPEFLSANKFSIHDYFVNQCKHLALPAGSKLLQMQPQVHNGVGKGRVGLCLAELGCFHHESQLASNMASMTESELDGLSGTRFVAHQELPLPTISLESFKAKFR